MEKTIENKYLYNNISILDGKQNLIIIDFYHSELIPDIIDELINLAKIDPNIIYLLFNKNSFQKGLWSNIYVEDRLAYIHFIVGFALAKNLTIYLFTSESKTNWLKIEDIKYKENLKFSEYEYIKVTLEYMLRDKKRNQSGKQNKLTLLFSEEKETGIDYLKLDNNEFRDKLAYKALFENIKKQLLRSNPKNILSIKNVIDNICEQNIKSFNCTYEILSFNTFSHLIAEKFIENIYVHYLIENNIIKNYNDLFQLQNYNINIKEEEIENVNYHKNNNKNKRKKNYNNHEVFSLSINSEKEYINLLENSLTICNFVKNVIQKILNTINLSSIDKLPSNTYKYKNYIQSFINNQELRHIASKIIILDYNSIVSILTEGVIIDLMKNNLISILSDSKVFYNLVKIEQEKYRLLNN